MTGQRSQNHMAPNSTYTPNCCMAATATGKLAVVKIRFSPPAQRFPLDVQGRGTN
ncbi:rCG60019 [Rattus norvegicus]|uniref:RCG60019 n=1 Tax=Rattus norvegicus TaxID=10116 RepID=A6HRT4_RAT|nr:rCG60019 [Rattus norvegicus]